MFTSSLISILDDLNNRLPDVEALGVVSGGRFLAGPLFPAELDEERSSALCGAMLTWGEKTARELGKGVMEQLLIRGCNGYAIISGAGDNALLVVLAQSDDGLEEIQRASESIAALFSLFR